jgi:hypothetical protein
MEPLAVSHETVSVLVASSGSLTLGVIVTSALNVLPKPAVAATTMSLCEICGC